MEILLAVLEAKLDSIPELSDGLDPVSSAAPATAAVEDPKTSVAPAASVNVTAAPPPTAPEAQDPSVPSGMIAVKDHPDYKPFAKLLKVGVPLQAAKNKLMAAGLSLDPSFLDNPDQLISSAPATSTALVPAAGDTLAVVD